MRVSNLCKFSNGQKTLCIGVADSGSIVIIVVSKLLTTPPLPLNSTTNPRSIHRDDLCYAVYDAGNPKGKISIDQQSKIEDMFNNKIVDHAIASKGNQPIESEFCMGVMLMRLASHQCVSTLKNLSTFYIKGWGNKLANERMLQIHGGQNAELAVEKWHIFYRKEEPEGTLFLIAVLFKIGKVPIGRAVTSTGNVESNPKIEEEITHPPEDRTSVLSRIGNVSIKNTAIPMPGKDTAEPSAVPTALRATSGYPEESNPKSEEVTTNSLEDSLMDDHD
ncbi:hypothetical protein FF38_12923 [Lucilia cuprina]|uniref:Uncharacterized protein n=1 Tax=Lucilia cuprina TaxID=7375 RepID=A0A0L0CLG3_LUCCU|nr:hypothetical protein FF38_12923 [Lucilia cuprina]